MFYQSSLRHYVWFAIAVLCLGLGIYFYPKQAINHLSTEPSIEKVTSKPEPLPSPSPKLKPAIQLSGDSTWQVFLPQGTEWVNTDKQLIGEKGTPVYHPRRNAFRFTTDDWNGTYLVKVGSQVFTPNQRYFSIGAEQGDCLSVYIKNISNHDLTLKMDITNYPSHYNPPTPCK